MTLATIQETLHRLPESVRFTVGALVLANLVPLACVLMFDWTVFPLMLLFWAENVIIGLFNVVRMLWVAPKDGGGWIAKAVLIPFFSFHYGMFTFVHGMFVVVLFGGGMPQGFPSVGNFVELVRQNQLMVPLIALMVSHGVSLVMNFVRQGEYRRTSLHGLMVQPYGRVMVLHFTILLGGFLMLALNSPVIGLALLILLKTVVDVAAHLRERKKLGTAATADGALPGDERGNLRPSPGRAGTRSHRK